MKSWKINGMDSGPLVEQLKAACPELPREFISRHIQRLTPRYFQTIPFDMQVTHLRSLYELTSDQPFRILIERGDENKAEITVLAFDYPGEFSALCGVLGSTCFNIQTGQAFTYSRAQPVYSETASAPGRRSSRGPTPARRTGTSKTDKTEPANRRRIIDRFGGRIESELPFQQWRENLEGKLSEILQLMEDGDENSIVTARRRINEYVADALQRRPVDTRHALLPIQIDIDENAEQVTRLTVTSEDTPFFLYALTNTLALHRVSIEHIDINTIGGRIVDTIEFLDDSGKPVHEESTLSHITVSILFTKQFTFFLGSAPDPYNALIRFEQLSDSLLRLPGEGKWQEFLSEPRILGDLARLLGASDFLWEDFIRLQYENILPMLKSHVANTEFSHHQDELEDILDESLEEADSTEESVKRLNDFKDREIYLIDLDHILVAERDFRFLSERLSRLAEVVIGRAADIWWEELTRRYGRPVTVAGLEAGFSILGLGKLGGAALGYASDIELICVYDDDGNTDGSKKINNSEFFEKLFREITGSIHAKREGIFQVDLRLRPYGNSGPLASSLSRFSQYYEKGGPAHSYERLALVRLRSIAGNQELGKRIESLRDEIIYASDSISLPELRALRKKQLDELAGSSRLNAKFSPGAMVDLEYTVQILQVTHGKEHKGLRTPRLHRALEGLVKTELLTRTEAELLIQAYHFFRRLVNSLRMLRGNAQDLYLPAEDSEEYRHLARRCKYTRTGDLSAKEHLHLDFESYTASIRAFVERHLGRDSIPGPPVANAADIVLSDTLPEELRNSILEETGFLDPALAYRNFKTMASRLHNTVDFARLAVLARQNLSESPDPDTALNNWEHYLSGMRDPDGHIQELLGQPRRLSILLEIFSASQFLSDGLSAHPEFLEWLSRPGRLQKLRSGKEIRKDLQILLLESDDRDERLEQLRIFRKRELLRIGTRDLCLKVPLRDITAELSHLASAIIDGALQGIFDDLSVSPEARGRFCIFAFGKLGGKELNYSSDVDLLGVYEDGGSEEENKLFQRVMEHLVHDLSTHTTEGHAYRVDLRLRPYGTAGLTAVDSRRLEEYYHSTAALWEFQALLKLDPVAGNKELGYRLLGRLHRLLNRSWDPEEIRSCINRLRSRSIQQNSSRTGTGWNIKEGEGGIRDIEFLVQGLQLQHIALRPEIFSGNTLHALSLLPTAEIISSKTAADLANDYQFLRRLEHLLQIRDDLQKHSLPTSQPQLKIMARMVIGRQAQEEQLLKTIEDTRQRVRKHFQSYLEQNMNDQD
ncbi:MAG: glutamate-ammonia-ligase adenylyltransferase [Spirochaetales bacterium]|nr:glutamate-ammonia-ligase adenylyltransferase [Spirochaetales bacterium]MCF7937770.1 glutamate-ammonia-ligase adenylyltransferase [Spirochaetales bacterium]